MVQNVKRKISSDYVHLFYANKFVFLNNTSERFNKNAQGFFSTPFFVPLRVSTLRASHSTLILSFRRSISTLTLSHRLLFIFTFSLSGGLGEFVCGGWGGVVFIVRTEYVHLCPDDDVMIQEWRGSSPHCQCDLCGSFISPQQLNYMVTHLQFPPFHTEICHVHLYGMISSREMCGFVVDLN